MSSTALPAVAADPQQEADTIGSPEQKTNAMSPHALGVLLIDLSAVAYSSAGFFTQLIHLGACIMLFWRGLFAGLMILWVIVVPERGRSRAALRAIGRPGLAAALCSTAATILCLNAFRRTSVADVAVIFASRHFSSPASAGCGWA